MPHTQPLIDWATKWRDEWGFMECICPCGVGFVHPDDRSFEAMGHQFGTCGKESCMKEWGDAMIKARYDDEQEESCTN